MIRFDNGRQAQGPLERTVRQLLHKILSLIRLILTFDANDIFQHLNVQVLGLESWHKSGKNVGIIFLADVHTESTVIAGCPATSYAAIWIRVQIECHGLVSL